MPQCPIAGDATECPASNYRSLMVAVCTLRLLTVDLVFIGADFLGTAPRKSLVGVSHTEEFGSKQ